MFNNQIEFFKLDSLDTLLYHGKFLNNHNCKTETFKKQKKIIRRITTLPYEIDEYKDYLEKVKMTSFKPSFTFSKTVKKAFTSYIPNFTSLEENISSEHEDDNYFDDLVFPNSDNTINFNKSKSNQSTFDFGYNYCIKNENIIMLEKIFYFKAFNKIVHLCSDGFKREYDIDYLTKHFSVTKERMINISVLNSTESDSYITFNSKISK